MIPSNLFDGLRGIYKQQLDRLRNEAEAMSNEELGERVSAYEEYYRDLKKRSFIERIFPSPPRILGSWGDDERDTYRIAKHVLRNVT